MRVVTYLCGCMSLRGRGAAHIPVTETCRFHRGEPAFSWLDVTEGSILLEKSTGRYRYTETSKPPLFAWQFVCVGDIREEKLRDDLFREVPQIGCVDAANFCCQGGRERL